MPRRLNTLARAALAAFVIAGCSGRSNPTAPVAGTPAATTGTLYGWVHQESQCHETERFGAGVVVSLEGTNFSATTDSSGDWRFDDLPFGRYTLSFTRPGYSSFKAFGYDFTRSEGARLSWFKGLIEKPTGVVSNLVVDTTSEEGRRGVRISYDVTSSCPSGEYESLILLGDSGHTLGPDHYVVTSGVMHSASGHVSAFYAGDDLAWDGLFSASRLFVRVYDARNFGYWNAQAETWVFTAVSDSGSAFGGCRLP